jgi:hypothetical protein
MNERPKFDTSWKPDFMAPNPKVHINKFQSMDSLLEFDNTRRNPLDAYDALNQDDRPRMYYESPKALGVLYRMIDERAFYMDIQSRWQKKSGEKDTILRQVLGYVLKVVPTVQYKGYMVEARQIRQTYEEAMINTMYNFSTRQDQPLHELEVMAGQILGSNTKLMRDISSDMRDAFQRDIAYVRDLFVRGTVHEDWDGGDLESHAESLPRSIACFKLAMDEKSELERQNGIRSWKFLAAGVCLRELAITRGGGSLKTLRSVELAFRPAMI